MVYSECKCLQHEHHLCSVQFKRQCGQLHLFAENYKNVSGSHVSGTTYESGWYLPSIAELFQIWKVKTTVDAASALCDSSEFGSDSNNYYWSSSLYASNGSYYPSYLYFTNGECLYINDSGKARACAIREF